MAQRKPPSNRPGASKSSARPAGKPGAASKTTAKGAAKTTAGAAAKTTKRPPGTGGAAARPPARKKNKSIVNQKQTPWGLIATTAAIVVFAAAVVVVVIATKKSDDSSVTVTRGGQKVDASGKDRYRMAEDPAAAKIKGVTYRVEGQATHVGGKVKYDRTPPIGGKHSAYWADCTGTVYVKAIANENAVHMMEHGAVWITYNADEVKGAQLARLKKYVAGIDRMAMSPYPNLSTPISLQAWGYQLKVSSATDPRIAQFIKALKFNQKTTPEPNATCSQPTFKESPSSFGNPKEGP